MLLKNKIALITGSTHTSVSPLRALSRAKAPS